MSFGRPHFGLPTIRGAPRPENLYATWSAVREIGPVVYMDDWRMVVTARHEVVSRVLRDERFGRDGTGVGARDPHAAETPAWNRYVRGSFMELDPPAHSRIRRTVSQAFSVRRISRLEHGLRKEAQTAFDGAAGTLDLVSGYATPIALRAIADLLGLPDDCHESIVGWSHDIVRLFEPATSVEVARQAERATLQFVAFVESLIAARRTSPAADLLSALAGRGGSADLTDTEIIATVILLLNAGHEATVHAITNAIRLIIEAPGAFETIARQLDEAGTIGDRVIAELLRFEAPLQLFHRWTLTDVELAGARLAAGVKVGLVLGGANRDPRRFSDPEKMDLHRSDNPHLSFGAGVHRCLGAALASLELRVAIEEFMRAAPRGAVKTNEADAWIDSVVFRGRKALPVRLR